MHSEGIGRMCKLFITEQLLEYTLLLSLEVVSFLLYGKPRKGRTYLNWERFLQVENLSACSLVGMIVQGSNRTAQRTKWTAVRVGQWDSDISLIRSVGRATWHTPCGHSASGQLGFILEPLRGTSLLPLPHQLASQCLRRGRTTFNKK